MILALISIVWLAALLVLVVRLATRPLHPASSAAHWHAGEDQAYQKRSPALLGSRSVSFEQAIGELLEATPVASSSKPATAENVRDGAQEDLYVRP
jgi:hypothetical protein